MSADAFVLLEDGTRFDGEAVGASGQTTGEVVFTTPMSGYQESVTDPSFAGQILTFTYPHVGNYGVSAQAMESDRIHARGAIMREAGNGEDAPGAEGGWLDWLRDCGVPAITGVDTRALVRHLRDAGAMRGGIFAGVVRRRGPRPRRRRARDDGPGPRARTVTPASMQLPRRPRPADRADRHRRQGLDRAPAAAARRRDRAASLHRDARRALAGGADPVFLANGPGDPAALDYIVETVRGVDRQGAGVGDLPRPPAALPRRRPRDLQAPLRPPRREPPGQGPAARAASRSRARTTASRCSRPGGGHTIDEDEAVRWDTDYGVAELTHVNLYDRTVEGLILRDVHGATVQYHPEAGPRPARRPLPVRPLPRRRLRPCRVRDDIHKILIIGSGPIVIGQAAEFDYSGTQACKVLREEGFEVVLVNSNPATIMTDPEFADRTYVEPLLPGPLEQIIERERPDAILPTLGGQTALNLAKALYENGTLEKYDVELIGANYDAIHRAEDRDLFRITMEQAGLRMPRSAIATTVDEARGMLADIGLPAIVRPAFTLGGRGGGIARTEEEFARIAARGIDASPISQILIDQSVLGWGEFEMEVMRDHADNVVIICSIENLDPMGVHTGDSVCVAPQQTLTDKQFQMLRDQAIAVIRAVGVETGGSNVQFAVNPATDEVLVIEMNPRVSRSSALASKATGFPIAKIAARLAVGYTLQEIPNDITRATPASFEPTIDYAVVKWPRFAFEKFPGSDAGLTTHMKSVGEAMAIGRTFQQAFAKAMRSRELDETCTPPERRRGAARRAGRARARALRPALRGLPPRDRDRDRPRPHEHRPLVPAPARSRSPLDPELPFRGLERSFKSVDTCAAEFPAETPYFYSGWERRAAHEVRRGDKASVVILGSGPNRIGQGIEFDYCCVHAAQTVRETGPRRGDAQLQPGDGLDRLRHLRPPVLRAAHARGRASRCARSSTPRA